MPLQICNAHTDEHTGMQMHMLQGWGVRPYRQRHAGSYQPQEAPYGVLRLVRQRVGPRLVTAHTAEPQGGKGCGRDVLSIPLCWYLDE